MSRDDDLDVSRGPREDIPNYLVQSILVTICCCVPLGIVAIINAAQVNSHLSQGNYAKAREASEAAKKWSMIGMIVGLLVNLVVAALQIIAATQNPAFR